MDFTTLNLILIITSILTFFIGDTVTTIIGLNNGMEEANPILGKKPSPYLLISVKLGFMAICMVVIELLVAESQVQTVRNIMYGMLTVVGSGVMAWNIIGITKAR